MYRNMLFVLLLWIAGDIMAQDTFSQEEAAAAGWEVSPEYVEIENSSFHPGEEIEFRATFGWFTVGKAVMRVDPEIYHMNDRPCYKIEVEGKTSGLVDWVVSVDDYWGSYVDTASLVSHQFKRVINEGNYRKHEITDFDHVNDSLYVNEWSFSRAEWYDTVRYNAPENVRDMISGYYFLRTVDFDQFNVGDTIRVWGFIEDTFYNLAVVYEGKEMLKTKAGTFRTIRLAPVIPDNSFFKGKDSVMTWISDDANRIPIKVNAKMFIGNAGVEIVSYRNLRN